MTRESYHKYLLSVIFNAADLSIGEKIDLRCQPISELNSIIHNLRDKGLLTETIMGFEL